MVVKVPAKWFYGQLIRNYFFDVYLTWLIKEDKTVSSSTRKKWYQTRLLIQFYTEALNVKLELESALTSAQKYCKQIEAMMIFIDKLQSLISGRRDNLHHRDTSRFVSSRNYSIKYLRNKKKNISNR